MNKKRNVLFTFDYELFLGNRSGTVENCLIHPTQKLMEVLKSYSAKGIFFIDTTYLIRLQKEAGPAPKNDFYKISEQIKCLIREGHYVFPHFHPHWIDAKYDSKINEWYLKDLKKYRFHNISSEERSEIFEASVSILRDIIKDVSSDYKLNGYRAGGWSIQPFSDFKPFFDKYDIKYDFSVLPGDKLFSEAQHYDFTTVPAKPIYKFTRDITQEEDNGKITEFTISKIEISPIRRFLNKIFLKISSFDNTKIGNGISVRIFSGNHNRLNNFEMISIELFTSAKYSIYREYIAANNYMHFISHPKMITLNGYAQFSKFLKEIFATYQVETDFKKMI